MGHFATWFWTAPDIERVLSLLERCKKPVFHICNGSSGIGDVRLDKMVIKTQKTGSPIQDKYRLPCTVIGRFEKLPFRSGVAETVLCDPPYDYEFINNTLIDELVRISKPKARIIFIAPWIPCNPNIKLINYEAWKVGKTKPYFKIASIFYKSNGQLGDYV